MDEIDLFAQNRPAVPEYSPAAKAAVRAQLTTARPISRGASTRPVLRRGRRALVTLVPVGGAAAAAATVLVAVGAGSATPARAEVAAAVQRTSAQSFRVTGTVQGSGGAPEPSEGTFDPQRGLGHMITQEPIGPTEVVFVGDQEYVKNTHTNYMNSRHYQPYRGKPWIRYPRGYVVEDDAAPITRAERDPQQALAYLREATKVHKMGFASGSGWTGRRYAFTVSPRFTSKVSIGGVTHINTTTITMTGTIDVDTHGRVRHFELFKPESVGSWLRGSLTFSDFGTPVSVTAPPADQVGTPTSEYPGLAQRLGKRPWPTHSP